MDFIDQLKPLFDWLHTHPGWAGFATFTISLTESLVILGLIIPGTVMMTAVGTLAGAGIINPWQTMVWAILGAIAGDSLSYRIGYHFRERLPQTWPFRKYPQVLGKGEEFFKKHGGKSVFIGRFVGPVRPVVPVIAGMLSMKPSKFLIANVVSAFLWAPFYMFPGMLLGYASLELEPATATRFIVTVVAALVLIGLTAWGFKIIIQSLLRLANKSLDTLWQTMNNHRFTHPLCILLADPRHPQGHGQLTMALMVCALYVAFIALFITVYHFDRLNVINMEVFHFFQSLNYPYLTRASIIIGELADETVVIPAFLLGALYLGWKKQPWTALHLAALVVLCVIPTILFKLFVDSPRPLYFIERTNSFPSGHATLNIAFYSFLAVLIGHGAKRSVRVCLYSFVTLYCMAIILTRLYLGAHWFTDVLGGALFGMATALMITVSWRRKETPPVSSIKLTLVILSTVVLICSLQTYRHLEKYVRLYTPTTPVVVTSLKLWWDNSQTSLPIYRNSRTSKPVQLFNLQWADFPKHIESELSNNGWKKLPKLTLISTINRISSKEREEQLPFLPKLNFGHKPLLVMVKPDPQQNIVLVLRLWNSNTVFRDSAYPLLYGTIEYQMPHTHKYWYHRFQRQLRKTLVPASVELEPALINYHWHRIHYSTSLKIDKITTRSEWQGGVLFIKPKNPHQHGDMF